MDSLQKTYIKNLLSEEDKEINIFKPQTEFDAWWEKYVQTFDFSVKPAMISVFRGIAHEAWCLAKKNK